MRFEDRSVACRGDMMSVRITPVWIALFFGSTALCCGAANADSISNGHALRLKPVGGRAYPPVITALAINQAEDLIAAAGDDHAIRLLGGPNFSEQRVIGRHNDWVRSLDFSPDGSTLLSAGNDGRIQIWRKSKAWKNPLDHEGGPALACARFSSDGSRAVAVGFDPEIFLLRFANQPKFDLSCGCRDLRAAVFARGDQLLAVGGRSGALHVFSTVDGQMLGDIPVHLGRLRDIAAIPSTNRLVSVGEDGRCGIVDLDQMQRIKSVEVPGCKLLSVACIDSRHVAVGGSDNVIRVIDINDGSTTRRLYGHQGSVAVLKSRSEYLISGSYDTSIRFWRLDEVRERETLATISTPGAAAIRVGQGEER